MAQVVLSIVFIAALASARQTELLYDLTEEQPSGTFVADVVADARLQDKYTAEEFPKLRFRFLSESDASGMFRIDPVSGVIRTIARVDRDSMCAGITLCRVKLDVAVQPVSLFRIVKVNVDVTDVNDNRPEFPESVVSHQLLESASPGNGFSLPAATDRDGPSFGVQRYELVATTTTFELQTTAKLDGSTAVRLVLLRRLDRETQALYRVTVIAYDGGQPALTARLDVSVRVLDANDNQPMFVNSTYKATIAENVPVGTSVATVRATDADTGINARVRYAFSQRTLAAHGHAFRINAATGTISVAGSVDYEESALRHLVVTAKDGGPDAVEAETTLVVHVKDVNDNPPVIHVSTLASGGQAAVKEDAPIGTFVAHVAITDADSGRNGDVSCSLERGGESFTLETLRTGLEYQLSTARVLDREMVARHLLVVSCRDNGEPPLVAVQRITVAVNDVNDHDPVFGQQTYIVTLMENNHVGDVIVAVNATDRDVGRNGDVRFSLLDDAENNVVESFRVDPLSGVITALRSFDREKSEHVSFVVVATDRGEPARSASATIIMTIVDVNDERPVFSKAGYSLGVYENKPAGTEVGFVSATDADTELYNQVRYLLTPGGSARDFQLDESSGRLSTTRPLDRETLAVYHLVITASDSAVDGLTSSVSVTVYVADQNDNAPVFVFPSPLNSTAFVSGLAPSGYTVTRVFATDADIDGNARLSYRLIDGDTDVFAIDDRRGEVTLLTRLSDVVHDRFELTVLATDSGYPQRSARAVLTVIVNDSLPLEGAGAALKSSALLGGHNLIVVIAIASVTFAIVVGLLLAIVLLRRQDASRRDHKYNCRMEALKMLTSRESSPGDSKTAPNGCLAAAEAGGRTKKEVSFSLDTDDGNGAVVVSHDKSGQSWPSTIDHHTLQYPQASSSVLNANISALSPINTAGATYHPLCKPADTHPSKASHLEVHQLLEMLKRDPETDSAYSGDGSNTDSGRGGSDEGEVASNHNSTNHASPHSSQLQCTVIEEDDSCYGNQIVPQLHKDRTPLRMPARTYMHTPTLSSRPAYTMTPVGMRTFGTPSRMTQETTGMSDTYCGGVMYSCADVNDILQTPSHLQVAPSVDSVVNRNDDDCDDDDDVTTTSGSYVVDAQQLCNEIDELFFRDLVV